MIKKQKNHHHSTKKVLGRFISNSKKQRRKKIYNRLKFKRFRGRIKGVRPIKRPLVLFLLQTSDRNSFNLDPIKHRQTNKLLYKTIYQVSWARYQPVESGSPSIERETCPFPPFPPLPLPRVSLDNASFTTYVCTFYPVLSDPIATLETLSVRFQTGPLLEERSLGRRLCCGLAPTKPPPTVYALPTPGFVCQKTAIRGS